MREIFHTNIRPSSRVVLLLNMIDITTVNDWGGNEISFDGARLPVWSLFTKKMTWYITTSHYVAEKIASRIKAVPIYFYFFLFKTNFFYAAAELKNILHFS